jgi:hypothetical protein
MRKKIVFLVLIALAAGAQISCGSSESGKFSPAALAQIKKAANIFITVEIEPKGLPSLKASVRNILEQIFAGLGLAVAKAPGTFPSFRVRISGDAIGKSYWVENAGYNTESYSGAKVKGDMVLAQTDNDKLKRAFSGRQEPTRNVFFAVEDPLDAPFGEALRQSDFLPDIAGLVDSCWGREMALAGIAGVYNEALPFRDWRMAVLRSLETFTDAKSTETLRAILDRHVNALTDPSVDTAFDDCIVKLLEILVERNDRASRPAVIMLKGKLAVYNYHGAWGDSKSFLEEIASRLK